MQTGWFRMEGSDLGATNPAEKKQHIPYKKRHFDDFPAFSRWDMLVSWRVPSRFLGFWKLIVDTIFVVKMLSHCGLVAIGFFGGAQLTRIYL